MSTIPLPVMTYVHPIIGAIAVILFFWVTTLGFRGRHKRPYAQKARRLHARFAQATFVLVVFSALGGTLSTLFLRPDLDVAGSWHFRFGWLVTAMMVMLAWTSQRFQRLPWARALHPWLGLLALAAAPILGALGFEMLP